MITFINSAGFASAPMSASVLLIPFLASLAFSLALYALRSIGLYCLAKRANVERKILAFFPFLWVYVACKLIGNAPIFGKPFNKMALIFCLIFTVAGILQLAQEVVCYFPIVGNLMLGRSIVVVNGYFAESEMVNYVETLVQGIYGVINHTNPDLSYVDPYATLPWVYTVLDVVSSLMMLLNIATIVISINIYIYLFRKYWPEHYILAMILSILGLFGIFTFIIRKKEPVNYADYLRSRYGSYGGYGNPYGSNGYRNPYNNYSGNPYNNPYGNGRQAPPKSPFEEFAGKGERTPKEPFGEFDNDKNDKE